MRYILSMLLVLTLTNTRAQDMEYARRVIDTLTHSHMHGRGYVANGDKVAATYIEAEFKRIGLRPISRSHIQEFTLPVNTFPGRMTVRFDGRKLRSAKDFLVMPGTQSMDVAYPTKRLTFEMVEDKKLWREFLRTNFDETVIIADNNVIHSHEYDELTKDNPPPWKYLVEVVGDVGAWSVSQDVSDVTHIKVSIGAMRDEPKKVALSIKNEWVRDYRSQNVIGHIKGTEHPDSFIVFTAHYDHLGRMGKYTMFPGANDNASGVSMLLNLAEHYAHDSIKHKYSIAFIAFGAEEAGLVGSRHYVTIPHFPLERIKFLVNMDLMGTGSEGMTVVNATEFPKQYDMLVALNDAWELLPKIKSRGKAMNSDHYWFTEKGVPSFFFYLMGPPDHYHDVYDRSKNLKLEGFSGAFQLINHFVDALEKGSLSIRVNTNDD